ncbi:DEKNAAC100503 [Brettanomyces naardenensis]|uniref:DEKNAAC100503 n=1 Tax=Brettanomyces naardenensis TaxID=13370 RepID=A0A448YG83_BRENA|nr:DEKNAAC100503 [Brettanomyces naardenensis]
MEAGNPSSVNEEQAAAQIFRKIRPSCIALSQLTITPVSNCGSSQLLDALKQLDLEIHDAIDSQAGLITIPTNLADYVFVPIAELLKKPSITDSELEYTLAIINELIEHCWALPGRMSGILFRQLLPLITFLIGGPPNKVEIENHSDETLENGVLCIKNLLIGAQNQGNGFLENILKEVKMMASLGHCVTVLLGCCLQCSKLEVKLQSLQSLGQLFQGIQDGEVISLMLPGVVSTFTKLVKLRPHYKVITEMFNVLSVVMVYTFDDFDLDARLDTLQELQQLKDVEPLKEGSLDEEFKVIIPENPSGKMHRTTAWLKVTLYQVRRALEIILKPVPNWLEHPEFRDAVFHIDISILRNCLASCSLLIPTVLKSMASLYTYDHSVEKSMTTTLAYSRNVSTLVEHLRTSLDESMADIGFSLGSPDSEKSSTLIGNIEFFLRCLISFQAVDKFMTRNIIEKLHSELTFVVQRTNSADSRRKHLVSGNEGEAYSTEIALVTSDYLDGALDHELKHTNVFAGVLEVSVVDSLASLLKVVASIPGVQLDISEYTPPSNFGKNINSVIDQSILLWIMDTAVNSAKERDSEFRMTESEGLDEFLSYSTNGPPADSELVARRQNIFTSLEVASDILEVNATGDINSIGSVMSSVVSLRTIGHACEVLGEEFRPELIDYLYPVIDRLASSNDVIRDEAQFATLKIASTLYGGSVKSLVYDNRDYLLDALSLRMTGDSLTPRLPIILIILIRIGGADLLQQLGDVITAIFTLLDSYYTYTSLSEGLFLVLSEVVDQIYKSYFCNFDFDKLARDSNEDNVLFHTPWGMNSMEEAIDFAQQKADVLGDGGEGEDDDLDERVKGDKILEISRDSDSDDEVQSVSSQHPEIPEDSEKWTSPMHDKTYGLVVDILEYAERLAKNQSSNLTIMALKLINRIIPLIASQRSRFLPVASSQWDFAASFLLTFNDPRIISLALKILRSLIDFGSTFFASKFTQLFNDLENSSFYTGLINRERDIFNKRRQLKQQMAKVIVKNRTSTSINWEEGMFIGISSFLQFCLLKLGRFIPMDVAAKAIGISIVYDSDRDDYGYFDDLADYMKLKC